MSRNKELIDFVVNNSNNFTTIIPINIINENKFLSLSGNGTGDRWCKKIFNYTFIYNNKNIYKTYTKDNYILSESELEQVSIFKSNNKVLNKAFLQALKKKLNNYFNICV